MENTTPVTPEDLLNQWTNDFYNQDEDGSDEEDAEQKDERDERDEKGNRYTDIPGMKTSLFHPRYSATVMNNGTDKINRIGTTTSSRNTVSSLPVSYRDTLPKIHNPYPKVPPITHTAAGTSSFFSSLPSSPLHTVAMQTLSQDWHDRRTKDNNRISGGTSTAANYPALEETDLLIHVLSLLSGTCDTSMMDTVASSASSSRNDTPKRPMHDFNTPTDDDFVKSISSPSPLWSTVLPPSLVSSSSSFSFSSSTDQHYTTRILNSFDYLFSIYRQYRTSSSLRNPPSHLHHQNHRSIFSSSSSSSTSSSLQYLYNQHPYYRCSPVHLSLLLPLFGILMDNVTKYPHLVEHVRDILRGITSTSSSSFSASSSFASTGKFIHLLGNMIGSILGSVTYYPEIELQWNRPLTTNSLSSLSLYTLLQYFTRIMNRLAYMEWLLGCIETSIQGPLLPLSVSPTTMQTIPTAEDNGAPTVAYTNNTVPLRGPYEGWLRILHQTIEYAKTMLMNDTLPSLSSFTAVPLYGATVSSLVQYFRTIVQTIRNDCGMLLSYHRDYLSVYHRLSSEKTAKSSSSLPSSFESFFATQNFHTKNHPLSLASLSIWLKGYNPLFDTMERIIDTIFYQSIASSSSVGGFVGEDTQTTTKDDEEEDEIYFTDTLIRYGNYVSNHVRLTSKVTLDTVLQYVEEYTSCSDSDKNRSSVTDTKVKAHGNVLAHTDTVDPPQLMSALALPHPMQVSSFLRTLFHRLYQSYFRTLDAFVHGHIQRYTSTHPVSIWASHGTRREDTNTVHESFSPKNTSVQDRYHDTLSYLSEQEIRDTEMCYYYNPGMYDNGYEGNYSIYELPFDYTLVPKIFVPQSTTGKGMDTHPPSTVLHETVLFQTLHHTLAVMETIPEYVESMNNKVPDEDGNDSTDGNVLASVSALALSYGTLIQFMVKENFVAISNGSSSVSSSSLASASASSFGNNAWIILSSYVPVCFCTILTGNSIQTNDTTSTDKDRFVPPLKSFTNILPVFLRLRENHRWLRLYGGIDAKEEDKPVSVNSTTVPPPGNEPSRIKVSYNLPETVAVENRYDKHSEFSSLAMYFTHLFDERWNVPSTGAVNPSATTVTTRTDTNKSLGSTNDVFKKKEEIIMNDKQKNGNDNPTSLSSSVPSESSSSLRVRKFRLTSVPDETFPPIGNENNSLSVTTDKSSGITKIIPSEKVTEAIVSSVPSSRYSSAVSVNGSVATTTRITTMTTTTTTHYTNFTSVSNPAYPSNEIKAKPVFGGGYLPLPGKRRSAWWDIDAQVEVPKAPKDSKENDDDDDDDGTVDVDKKGPNNPKDKDDDHRIPAAEINDDRSTIVPTLMVSTAFPLKSLPTLRIEPNLAVVKEEENEDQETDDKTVTVLTGIDNHSTKRTVDTHVTNNAQPGIIDPVVAPGTANPSIDHQITETRIVPKNRVPPFDKDDNRSVSLSERYASKVSPWLSSVPSDHTSVSSSSSTYVVHRSPIHDAPFSFSTVTRYENLYVWMYTMLTSVVYQQYRKSNERIVSLMLSSSHYRLPYHLSILRNIVLMYQRPRLTKFFENIFRALHQGSKSSLRIRNSQQLTEWLQESIRETNPSVTKARLLSSNVSKGNARTGTVSHDGRTIDTEFIHPETFTVEFRGYDALSTEGILNGIDIHYHGPYPVQLILQSEYNETRSRTASASSPSSSVLSHPSSSSSFAISSTYQDIFHYLLRIQYIQWLLTYTYQESKVTEEIVRESMRIIHTYMQTRIFTDRSGSSPSRRSNQNDDPNHPLFLRQRILENWSQFQHHIRKQFRLLSSHRYTINHFITILYTYSIRTITDQSWERLIRTLSRTTDTNNSSSDSSRNDTSIPGIQGLQALHAQYMDELRHSLFIDGPSTGNRNSTVSSSSSSFSTKNNFTIPYFMNRIETFLHQYEDYYRLIRKSFDTLLYQLENLDALYTVPGAADAADDESGDGTDTSANFFFLQQYDQLWSTLLSSSSSSSLFSNVNRTFIGTHTAVQSWIQQMRLTIQAINLSSRTMGIHSTNSFFPVSSESDPRKRNDPHSPSRYTSSFSNGTHPRIQGLYTFAQELNYNNYYDSSTTMGGKHTK